MSSSRLFARPHIALMTRHRLPGVNLETALDAVAPSVREALVLASQELARLGIRHAVCGGLAVGAHGYPRATKDVDFLVGDEAFEHHGPIVTSRVPFQVGGIAVDAVHFPDAPFLEAELPGPGTSLSVVSPGALTYMKLRAGRMRDRSDLAELIKAGLDVDAVRGYLQAHAPEMVGLFDKIAEAAAAEEP